MSQGIRVARQMHVQKRAKGRREVRAGRPAPAPPAKVPRIAKLMALAIRFDQLIRDGVVADQAELARLGRVTRSRLTQIMNLLNLAPEIQEKLLFLPRVEQSADPVSERELRTIAAELDWMEQRHQWNLLHKDPVEVSTQAKS